MKSAHLNKSTYHWLDAWHVDPSANRNYDFIDGLRGVAILMVVVCHYFYFNPAAGSIAHFFGHLFGTMGAGVTLFFTISGFLIAWPFWKRKIARAEALIPPGYAQRRFWKIYPPLALSVLLLTPCWILWKGDASLYALTAIQWLTGLAFLMPVSGKFNPVMWSLVVEVHFYLVLPLLFLLTKALSPKKTLVMMIIFFFVVPLVARALTGLSPTFSPEINDPFPAGLVPFCFGVCLSGVDNLKLWNKNWARLGDVGLLLLPIGLAGLAWADMNPQYHRGILAECFSWTFIMGAGCLLCYAADPQHPRAKLLCSPWLRWCGIISYEWYLFHQPMAYWSRDLWGPANGSILKYTVVVGLPLLISLSFSALVYRKFSLPILKYGRSSPRALPKV